MSHAHHVQMANLFVHSSFGAKLVTLIAWVVCRARALFVSCLFMLMLMLMLLLHLSRLVTTPSSLPRVMH